MWPFFHGAEFPVEAIHILQSKLHRVKQGLERNRRKERVGKRELEGRVDQEFKGVLVRS
jgi:hypothetical protein